MTRRITIAAHIASDPAISAADLGVLIRVIDQLDSRGGVITIDALSIGNGPAQTRAALDRLTAAGYLVRGRVRSSGRLKGTEYAVALDPMFTGVVY